VIHAHPAGASAGAFASAPAEYLALGDSYSIGEGVEDGARWPTRLAEALRARGLAISHPHYIARTGWTTDELSAGIDAEQGSGRLRPPYGLVSLQIGVNDQYRGRPVSEFKPQFTALLERALVFAGGERQHVLVLSIPDWGVTPFARASGRDRAQVAAELDAYNAATCEICTQRGVKWIDVTGLTRAPGAEAEVVDDGLHPSPAMYGRWVARIVAEFPAP
jgi:lysophospholipase L1-like esterase